MFTVLFTLFLRPGQKLGPSVKTKSTVIISANARWSLGVSKGQASPWRQVEFIGEELCMCMYVYIHIHMDMFVLCAVFRKDSEPDFLQL